MTAVRRARRLRTTSARLRFRWPRCSSTPNWRNRRSNWPQQDLKSFQQTVDIGERNYKTGAISENDYLKIKLQLLQFETDVEQAQLAKEQALSICGSCWATNRCRRLRRSGALRIPAGERQSRRVAAKGPAESAGPARGAARRNRCQQPVRTCKRPMASRTSPFRATTRT